MGTKTEKHEAARARLVETVNAIGIASTPEHRMAFDRELVRYTLGTLSLGLDANSDNAKREGYMLALSRVRRFGEKLTGDKALSDEERYILDQAADILEDQAPGEAS